MTKNKNYKVQKKNVFQVTTCHESIITFLTFRLHTSSVFLMDFYNIFYRKKIEMQLTAFSFIDQILNIDQIFNNISPQLIHYEYFHANF